MTPEEKGELIVQLAARAHSASVTADRLPDAASRRKFAAEARHLWNRVDILARQQERRYEAISKASTEPAAPVIRPDFGSSPRATTRTDVLMPGGPDGPEAA